MITRPKKQEKQEENEGLFTREPTPEVDNISVIESEPTESRKRKATEELDEPKRKNANQGNRESRKSRSRSREYRKHEYESRNHEPREYGSRRYQNPEYEHDTLRATLAISITLPAIMEQLIQLRTENGRDCKLVYQQLRTIARILAETSYKKISNL